jgi:hypothetical protein
LPFLNGFISRIPEIRRLWLAELIGDRQWMGVEHKGWIGTHQLESAECREQRADLSLTEGWSQLARGNGSRG